MKTNLLSKFYRLFILLNALVLIGAASPRAVQATHTTQAVYPFIEVVSIKADDTVTVKLTGLPVNKVFTIRLDVVGDNAVDGIVVGETNSGTTGTVDATYRIPAELRGKSTIAIRIDAPGGWYAYNWFNNKTLNPSANTPTPAPTTPAATPIPVTSEKPGITIVAVEKNNRITVRALDFPANTTYNVRVGPTASFFSNYVIVTTVNSGSGGTFDFIVTLPALVKDVETVTVRLDSKGASVHSYAYNIFKNVSKGTVTTPVVTPTPTTTATPVVTSGCQVVSVEPAVKTMGPRYDFDASWTVRNTSGKDWVVGLIDFKYVSGTKMHRYNSVYDVNQVVKAGETIKVMVDMMGPEQVGTYTTEWALVDDSKTLCSLPLTITVK